LSVDGVIAAEHLPVEKMRAGYVRVAPAAADPGSGPAATVAANVPVALTPAPSTGDAERDRVIEALQQCAGNQTHAARLLGISRGTLLARLNAYNLPRPRKNKP
jgi:transcriptional regulator of acetoin/glycerol metabolism